MVPTHWVFLDELPRAPNGTVHRKALPAPETGPPGDTDRRAGSDEPSTPMERVVAGHWRKVLHGVERIGTQDRFVDLGGESLGAMQTLAWLERETGVRVEPMDMARQTLGQLAKQYERHATRTVGAEGRPPVGRLRSLVGRLFGRTEGGSA